jgi:hypothetical protein
MPISTDGRIKFNQTIRLNGRSAIVCAEVYGGPILRLQAAVFDANDKVIDGVGFDPYGPMIDSARTGKAEWLFVPKPNASYIKWGVQVLRLSAGLGGYSVTGKVRDEHGDTVASGRFAGVIADGSPAENLIYDGVRIMPSAASTLPKGPDA